MGKRRLVGVGLVSAALVALLTLGYMLTRASAPLSTVKVFVASVETNDFDTAYSMFHADLRRRESFPEFVERWSARALYLHDTNRLWSTDIDNGAADINVRFTTSTREDWSAVFQLIEQDDVWRISDYHFLEGPPEVDVVP
ncbi:MAG: DUF4864 domain-containing protein [Chloroflexi bacterium]|nr:DUF4864 domain-containing protein [Chloroflexota bacterium]